MKAFSFCPGDVKTGVTDKDSKKKERTERRWTSPLKGTIESKKVKVDIVNA